MNPRAIDHYGRWTRSKFPSARLYVFVVVCVSVTSLVTWWLAAAQIGEKFDWATWIKLSALFSSGGSLLVFVVRLAAIHGSWIVAKQALDLIDAGEGGRAWVLLADRYRGVHPLVINEPAFREILAAAVKASDDTLARQIVPESDDPHARSERESASEQVKSRARNAAIIIAGCVLMALVGIVRIFLW